MKTRVEKVLSSLQVGFDDVRIIGIKGMGGSGKTTLARVIFDHISSLFEAKSFVENVREGSKGSGLKELQKHVLSTVLNDQSIVVAGVSDGKHMIKKTMHSRKVLLVLDDVDDTEQLEGLVGEPTWFKLGSRIIITTRDEQLLIAHGVQSANIHDVSLLSREEAICLLSRYAFKKEIPNQGYEELSRKVVTYAAGLPLTIKVLGSFLCGRTTGEWDDAFEKLKTIPLEKTLKKLELSYNGLEKDQKEIFLDVACILKVETKKRAIRILESCGYYGKIGLRVLEQRSLITTCVDGNDLDGYYERLDLHDHIEEMGMSIVRRLHPEEPNKHSRLWIKEEIEDILVNDLGTEATRSISLKDTRLQPAIVMQGLRKMKELRFLDVFCKCSEPEVDELCQYFPNSLRYLRWYGWPGYPFRCLPKAFQANYLVNLEMPGSNISQLWEGGERKVLNSLKFLTLRCSKLRNFDLGITPNLEILDLAHCEDFVKLNIPDECLHLEKLNLSGCKAFVELHMPATCPKLKSLNLSNSGLRKLNLRLTLNLEKLDLACCYNFVELSIPFELPKLKFLYLTASKLRNLNLVMAPCLEKLDLGKCFEFLELHMPIEFSKLKLLNLHWTKVSSLNLRLTPNLEKLNLGGCNGFKELHVPVECPKLKVFILGCCKVSNINHGLSRILEKCESLKKLDLWFEDIKYLPNGIWMLKNLKRLNFTYCWHLEQLPQDLGTSECLEELYLKYCISLRDIPNCVGKMKRLKTLDLSYCFELKKLPEEFRRLESLKQLNIEGAGIRHVPQTILQLKDLCLIGLPIVT